MSQIRNNPPAATVGQKLIKKINMDCMAIAIHRLANTPSVSATHTTKQVVLSNFFIVYSLFLGCNGLHPDSDSEAHHTLERT